MKPIIGFGYVRRRLLFRQIRKALFNEDPQAHVKVWVRPCVVYKARFREKSLSSNKTETVPQTDTGDQVE